MVLGVALHARLLHQSPEHQADSIGAANRRRAVYFPLIYSDPSPAVLGDEYEIGISRPWIRAVSKDIFQTLYSLVPE